MADAKENKDVEMKEKGTEETIVENESMVVEDIRQNFAYLEKAVANFDPRFTLKVLRGLPALRKKVTGNALAKVIELTYPKDDSARDELLGYVYKASKDEQGGDESMDIDDQTETNPPTTILPEVDMFLYVLVLVWLLNLDEGKWLAEFKALSESAARRLRGYNRRSLDYIAAKVWFYYARGMELTGMQDSSRPVLLAALRTATLRRDAETQASLITLLLRGYLATHKVSQAAALVAKTTFPELASNSLAARYLYYLARINAIQLNYSAAHERVTAAVRKAPQTPQSLGFLQTAHKLSVVVELLMGDIPERTTFKEPQFEKPLLPYFEIARAVRVGDVGAFTEAVERHCATLKKDGNHGLVLRLRQNVIKTGIRIMSLTYSRISLRDICVRLGLDSEESAEYIVAKAIRDGVIDASIDHEHGYMQSKEVLDVYSTTEPQDAFHDRITFCIQLHNDSVKSMRYTLSDNRIDLKSAEEAREREKELVSEIQDGTDIDDDDDFEI